MFLLLYPSTIFSCKSYHVRNACTTFWSSLSQIMIVCPNQISVWYNFFFFNFLKIELFKIKNKNKNKKGKKMKNTLSSWLIEDHNRKEKWGRNVVSGVGQQVHIWSCLNKPMDRYANAKGQRPTTSPYCCVVCTMSNSHSVALLGKYCFASALEAA